MTTTAATSVVKALRDQYYAGQAAGDDMSSHWRAFSGNFQVEVDGEGVLTATGFGFGDCHWKGAGHRAFDTLTRLVHLCHLHHRSAVRAAYADAVVVVQRMGLDPTFDVFRQACTAAFLSRHVPEWPTLSRVVLIGDGYGVLGALIKTWCPQAQVVFVDLGQTLLFQAHHVGRAFPAKTHAMVNAASGTWPDADFVYCPSEHATRIGGLSGALAVNVASMQEMSAEVVARYFAILRRYLAGGGLFYCCNRERKVMPGGEVSEFERYPWQSDDEVLVDERCPWHQYYLAPRGSARVGGLPVPFLQFYDGPHKHRLARFR